MSELKDVASVTLLATDGKPLLDLSPLLGSKEDFAGRLRSLLPTGWFPSPPQDEEIEEAPALAAVLLGFGSVFSWAWALLGGVAKQSRIGSMDGAFLDIAAADYFGNAGLLRRQNETDSRYRARIASSLVDVRNTRTAVERVLTSITGAAPRIVEPMNAGDCRALGGLDIPIAGGGYGWGSSSLRYGHPAGGQFFVETVPGNASGAVEIAAAVERTKALGVMAWIRVES